MIDYHQKNSYDVFQIRANYFCQNSKSREFVLLKCLFSGETNNTIRIPTSYLAECRGECRRRQSRDELI